jgi:hypothetical protein
MAILLKRKYNMRRPGVVGEGYGDGKFSHTCGNCHVAIDNELLRVTKFRNDALGLVKADVAMPGTILDQKSGIPKQIPTEDDRLFPSRLIRKGLLAQVVELLDPKVVSKPSMIVVRDMIENITSRFADSKGRKEVDDRKGIKGLTPHMLNRSSSIQVRRLMSRYWENSSPFALDLSGAVMRQGVFTEKMYKVK